MTDDPTVTGAAGDESGRHLRAFEKAVDGLFNVEWGGEQTDPFGGQLLFVYRAPESLEGCQAGRSLEESGVTREDFAPALLAAYETFSVRARPNVTQTLIDLAAVCIGEALRAAGIRYRLKVNMSPEGRDGKTRPVTYQTTTEGGMLMRRVVTRGRFSQWTAEEMRPVISGALSLLPKPRRTYENVLSILKGIYGDDVPNSPEALRKAIERAGLDWRDIKADIE